MHVHTHSHKQALSRGTPDTDRLCAISILFEPICSTHPHFQQVNFIKGVEQWVRRLASAHRSHRELPRNTQFQELVLMCSSTMDGETEAETVSKQRQA